MIKKPVVFLDVETTGTSTTRDRIVQFSAIKVQLNYSDGVIVSFTTLEQKNVFINPKMKIPTGASEVHGIYDKDVADCPDFGYFASSIYKMLEGCVLAGYNVRSFDIQILSEEFARYGITFPVPNTPILDCMKIFQNKEPRTLAGALKFYCGKEIVDAHDALADTAATIDVFIGQAVKYGEEINSLTDEDVTQYCLGDAKPIDLAGKIVRNEKGEAVYSFGKCIGVPVLNDVGFASWMLKNDFSTDTKKVVSDILSGKLK